MKRAIVRVTGDVLKFALGITDENTLLIGVRQNPFTDSFELLLTNPKYEDLPEMAEPPAIDIKEA